MKSNQLVKIKGLFNMIEEKYPKDEKFLYYTPTFMNYMLETFIRFQMPDHVAEILKYFIANKTYPKKILLRTLGRMNYLTDELYHLLNEFNFKAERVSNSVRTVTENNVNPIETQCNEAIDKYQKKNKKTVAF